MIIHRLERFISRRWPQLALAAGFVGMGALSFCLGRLRAVSRVEAQPPTAPPARTAAAIPPNRQQTPDDKWREPVAYIYGTIPITYGDLAEYLIARQGADRLAFLVNKRIIEHVCQQRGIRIEEAEINAAVNEDVAKLGVTQKDFEEKVLKRYGKNLYEWREDVVRPKLLLNKWCRDRVQVTSEDLAKAYEAYHGEKLECRIIMWPVEEKNRVMNELYPKIRDDDKEFDRVARHQANARLAANGGKLDETLGRYTTGSEEVEKAAFGLHPGEITSVLEWSGWLVVIKVDKRNPPEKDRPSMEQVAP